MLRWRLPENKARQVSTKLKFGLCLDGMPARGLYLRTGFVGMARWLVWHFVAVSYLDGIEILFSGSLWRLEAV